MFRKLRYKIIAVTMAITTAVLLVASVSIMVFSSTLRPEPEPFFGITFYTAEPNRYIDQDQELQNFIKNDRREGNSRLLITLLCVGAGVELLVFTISWYLSDKIVAPVESAYDKQKIFIANASHELKTPLAVIEANMEALEVDAESEEWKTNIETEITHANKLVLDLLQLAKMDAGTIAKTSPERLDLAVVVKDRVEIFKPKFSGKITFQKKAKVTEHTLPKQDFLQVLDILLDNATKYADKKISIILEENSLAVQNDGANIPESDLEKIFDRFYQTDKTREGSGLGLAIAKSLCDQNHWSLSCTSSRSTTCFVLVLS